MKHFEEIKKHLNRKRDTVKINNETDEMIDFTVSNRCFEKSFYIWYFDSFSEDRLQTRNLRNERPAGKHYWMAFNQENYPQRQTLVSISDMSWYADEEELLNEIKRLCRNWRR